MRHSTRAGWWLLGTLLLWVTPTGAQALHDPLEGETSAYLREAEPLFAGSRFVEAARAFERGFRETGSWAYLSRAGGALLRASTSIEDPNWRAGMRYVRYVLHHAPTAAERVHAVAQVWNIQFPFGSVAGLEDLSRAEGEAFRAEVSARALYSVGAAFARRRPDAAEMLSWAADFRGAIDTYRIELNEAMYTGVPTTPLVAGRDSLTNIQATLDSIVQADFRAGGDRVRGAAAVGRVGETHGVPELHRWAALALLHPPRHFADSLYRTIPVGYFPEGYEPTAAEADAAAAHFRAYLAAEPTSAARPEIERWLASGRFAPDEDEGKDPNRVLPAEESFTGPAFDFGSGTEGRRADVTVRNETTGASRKEYVSTYSRAESCALTAAGIARALGMDAGVAGTRLTFREQDRASIASQGGCAVAPAAFRAH